jgi:hypothetical protein
MPSPSTSLATLRPDLAGSLQEFDFFADQQGFIASKLFPVLDVNLKADTYGVIPLEQLLQEPEVKRAPGAEYAHGNMTFTTDSYTCQEYGWEEVVDDLQAKKYRHYFDAEMVQRNRAVHIIMKAMEKRVASQIFNASTYSGASKFLSVSTEWSTASTCTPVSDVEFAVRKVYSNTGLWPNALVVSKTVFRNLRLCTQIIDRIASAGAGNATKAADITPAMLAQVFDLKYLFVGGGTKNSATEGQAATPGEIWDDEYAMVCRVAESNDIAEPCLGRTFHWTEDGSEVLGTVESYRDDRRRGNVVRVRHDVHEKIVYTECGFLLGNITA